MMRLRAPRPRLLRPAGQRPGLALLLGLTLAMITAVAGVGRLILDVQLHDAANQPALEQRLTRGRMIVATHLNDERTRTLLIAEATASQVGLPGAVVADDQPQTLRLLEASRRVNQPPLLAAIDLHDKVVAATPATNLPLAE